SDIVVKYSTLEDYVNSPAVQLLGRQQIGYRAKVTKEQYKMIITQDISKKLTLHELSFGSIPEIIASSIERLFGFDWFIAIALVHNEKLIGTISFAGNDRLGEPDADELRMFSNITTSALIRKQAEKELRVAAEELRQRNEFIQAVIDNLPIGLALNSISNGKKLYMNKQFTEIYGWSDEDIVDVPTFFEKVYPDPEYRKQVIERVNADLASGDPTRMIWDNMRITTETGEKRYIYARNIPLSEQDLMVSTVQDITERIRAEEEKAKLEEQFQHSQKMESIGQLAGGVAHDLNNLLTPILGYGDMLYEEFIDGDQRKESVEQIILAGERARDMVQQLLAFSRKQMLDFKSININDTINGFASLLKRTIRENIAINIVLTPQVPSIRGDIGQLEQVIMNLAVNAQDAMPSGGMLTIKTSVVAIDEDYITEYTQIKPGKYVLLTISDTGQGMSAETRAHLFEPFFTTKEKGKGTGLGLATTYGIVKQHGGQITIYSELGHGTTCNIYLPILDKEIIESIQVIKKTTCTHGTETILVVEDNDIVRKLTNAVLTQHGYTVLLAEDGPEALRILDEFEDKVDMVLTDVVMPGMSGKELCEIITPQYPDMKILYMSGYAEDVIMHQGVLEKGVAFLHKPFTVQMLAAKVREVLCEDRREKREERIVKL
ncbi:MAG: ATP-binding protein, partial [bacterium]